MFLFLRGKAVRKPALNIVERDGQRGFSTVLSVVVEELTLISPRAPRRAEPRYLVEGGERVLSRCAPV